MEEVRIFLSKVYDHPWNIIEIIYNTSIDKLVIYKKDMESQQTFGSDNVLISLQRSLVSKRLSMYSSALITCEMPFRWSTGTNPSTFPIDVTPSLALDCCNCSKV